MTIVAFTDPGPFSWENDTGDSVEVTIHAWGGGSKSQGLNGFLWEAQAFSTSNPSAPCVVHTVTVPDGSILGGTVGAGATLGGMATMDDDPDSWGTPGGDTEIELDDVLIVFAKGAKALVDEGEDITGEDDAAECIGDIVHEGGGGCGGGDGLGQGAGAPGTPIAAGLGDQPYGPINPDGTRGGCGASEANNAGIPIREDEWALGDWAGKFPGASGGSSSAGEGGDGHDGAVKLFLPGVAPAVLALMANQ